MEERFPIKIDTGENVLIFNVPKMHGIFQHDETCEHWTSLVRKREA